MEVEAEVADAVATLASISRGEGALVAMAAVSPMTLAVAGIAMTTVVAAAAAAVTAVAAAAAAVTAVAPGRVIVITKRPPNNRVFSGCFSIAQFDQTRYFVMYCLPNVPFVGSAHQ